MVDEYRHNAGIVVFNRSGKVLLCKRNDVANSWQFPQGGIEEGETPLKAALRELKEETSLVHVKPLSTLSEPVRYRFPPKILASMQARGFTNVGQEIYWSLCFFDGDDAEINLNTAEPEFSAFRWTTLDKACELIVDFKKEAYVKARTSFQKLIEEYIVSNASGSK